MLTAKCSGQAARRGAFYGMQDDGRFGIFHPDKKGRALWATGTDDYPRAVYEMRNDGNLVVYARPSHEDWEPQGICKPQSDSIPRHR
jgi:hypothetical protein